MPLFNLPPPSFYFSVSFDGDMRESSFQEVSGLKAEWKMQEVAEGGQNRFVHKLPTRTSYGNVRLKRGVVVYGSALALWLGKCFEADFVSKPVTKMDVIIQLLNGKGDPILKWTVFGAYPLSWDHSALSSQANNLLVETVELSCAYFEREAV